jgi:hypothetical protein
VRSPEGCWLDTLFAGPQWGGAEGEKPDRFSGPGDQRRGVLGRAGPRPGSRLASCTFGASGGGGWKPGCAWVGLSQLRFSLSGQMAPWAAAQALHQKGLGFQCLLPGNDQLERARIVRSSWTALEKVPG